MKRLLRAGLRRFGPLRRFVDARRASAPTVSGADRIRASGWFDEAWYREQVGDELAPEDDAVEHYLRTGSEDKRSPHPLFDPVRYVKLAGRIPGGAAPFLDFVTRGAKRGTDPHPLFDTAHYLEQVPDAADHPRGPFGHFLEHGARLERWPHEDVPAGPIPGTDDGNPYVAAVAAATRAARAATDHTRFRRTFPSFDHAAAGAFVERATEVTRQLTERPLVSVILPTKDREDVVGEAIDSVLAQTYPEWELIVVDDGGRDGTGDLVRRHADTDRRVRYVHQDNTGVAGARNHGVRLATGRFVAYLDSDNTWVPEFLEVMVGHLASTGSRAAYSASELRNEDGRLEYRGRPLHREALREKNYIDCITLVHERSLFDEVSGFDERLRRVVDWDLLIRLSEVTDLTYAPFVGTSYDLWDDREDRITLFESVGYRYVVRDKHLTRWDEAPEPVSGHTSIVIVARGHVRGALLTARDAGGAVQEATPRIVIVDDGCGPGDSLRLRLFEQLHPGVRVLRIGDAVPTPVARNVAAATVDGDVVLFADAGVRLTRGAVAALTARVRGGVDLVQPTVLRPDGTVRTTGQRLARDGTTVTLGSGLAGDDPAMVADPHRDTLEGHCLAAAARTFRRLRGFDPLFVRGGGDTDLCLRITESGGTVAWEPEAQVVIQDVSSLSDTWSPTGEDARELARRRPGPHPVGIEVGHRFGDLRIAGFSPLEGEQRYRPERWTAHLTTSPPPAPDRRLRFAIKIAAPDVSVREAWGDYHFARGLADALRALGHHAVVDCRKAWYRDSAHLDDVNISLRGTQPVTPNPGQVNLCWMISHPERVRWDELHRYDQLFVASTFYAQQLNERWPELGARPLLQCTDPARFYPDPDPALREDVLFVGNSRKILRTVVRDAITAELDVGVYGEGWDELIPARYLRGVHVPNEVLRRHYSSAGVVLNDHWDDMREHGFVSNRLFDAVACGAPVVSDDIPGLEELFGGAVVTYHDPSQLAAAVAAARTQPEHRAAAAARAAAVARDHSFASRAQALLDAAIEIRERSPELGR